MKFLSKKIVALLTTFALLLSVFSISAAAKTAKKVYFFAYPECDAIVSRESVMSDYSYKNTTKYDKKGRPTEEISYQKESKKNAKYTPASKQTYKYDKKGRTSQILDYNYENKAYKLRGKTVYSYSDKVRTEKYYDYDQAKAVLSSKYITTVDSKERYVKTQSYYLNSKKVLTLQYETNYKYGKYGTTYEKSYRYDEAGKKSLSSEYTSIYNKNKQNTGYTSCGYNSDGSVSYGYKTDYTYNKKGDQTKSVEYSYNYESKKYEIQSTNTIKYTYNKKGTLTKSVETAVNAEGKKIATATCTYTSNTTTCINKSYDEYSKTWQTSKYVSKSKNNTSTTTCYSLTNGKYEKTSENFYTNSGKHYGDYKYQVIKQPTSKKDGSAYKICQACGYPTKVVKIARKFKVGSRKYQVVKKGYVKVIKGSTKKLPKKITYKGVKFKVKKK